MNQVEVKRRQIEMASFIIGLINILIFGSKLENNGITYLIIALECVAFVRTVSSGCLADVLGKMLRSRIAKSQFRNSLFLRRRVLILQGIVGVVCSVVLIGLSGVLTQRLFQVQHSTFILIVMAPVLLLRTLSAVLTGFFQGEGSELPAAVAALLRQLLIMGFGLLFVNILGDYGSKVSNLLGDEVYVAMYGGVGVAVAFVLSELLVLLFLAAMTMANQKTRRQRVDEGMRQTDSFVNTVRILYGSMGLPILLQVFELLPLCIGTVFYRKSTADMTAFTENFGLFSGKFLTVCAMIALVIGMMLVSVNGRLLGAYRKEDYRSAKTIFQCGLQTVSVYGLFFTIFIAIMAEQLTGMVYGTSNEVLTGLFRSGSVFVLLMPLYYYLSQLLRRMGKSIHCWGVWELPIFCLSSLYLYF